MKRNSYKRGPRFGPDACGYIEDITLPPVQENKEHEQKENVNLEKNHQDLHLELESQDKIVTQQIDQPSTQKVETEKVQTESSSSGAKDKKKK